MSPDHRDERTAPPYRSHAAYLRERFGEKVHRIALDAGLGCPHREGGRGAGGCVYCSPAGSGTGAYDRGLGVKEQMQAGIERLARSGVRKYIAYFQAFCGTHATPGVLEGLYLEALAFPGAVGLSVGTRPDLVPDPVLELLAEIKAHSPGGGSLDVWLELGLQSADDKTLARLRRGHDVACFDDAVLRAERFKISTAAHVILGLPGEGRDQMLATARHLGGLPVKGVKLHHLYVEEGTALAKDYAGGAFKTLARDEYMELAIDFLRRLRPGMVVMRLSGRGYEERLIAPEWGSSPGSFARELAEEMKRRGIRQGDLYPGGHSTVSGR